MFESLKPLPRKLENSTLSIRVFRYCTKFVHEIEDIIATQDNLNASFSFLSDSLKMELFPERKVVNQASETSSEYDKQEEMY